MTDKIVTIEVNGVPVEAIAGQMLIEVTDRQDVYVPRFCYHEKLSVAANCRMCLVCMQLLVGISSHALPFLLASSLLSSYKFNKVR